MIALIRADDVLVEDAETMWSWSGENMQENGLELNQKEYEN